MEDNRETLLLSRNFSSLTRQTVNTNKISLESSFSIGNVLGVCPTIKQLNKLQSDNIVYVQNIMFWYHFRRLFPIVSILLFILMFLIGYYIFNDHVDGYLLCGGSLSIVFSFLVIKSYIDIKPWRKHPSTLILYRTGSCLLFSIMICIYPIYNFINNRSDHVNNSVINTSLDDTNHSNLCGLMSFANQFVVFSGELWVFTISIDLFTSLTNPFSSYKQNIKKYFISIMIISLISSIALVSKSECQGIFLNDGLCWLKVNDIFSPCLWGFALSWIIIIYTTSVIIFIFAYIRLSNGLESTYYTRKSCVNYTFQLLSYYLTYLLILILLYICINKLNLTSLLIYFISTRGYIDSYIWFMMHDFQYDNQSNLMIDRIAFRFYYPFIYCYQFIVIFFNRSFDIDVDRSVDITRYNNKMIDRYVANDKKSGYMLVDTVDEMSIGPISPVSDHSISIRSSDSYSNHSSNHIPSQISNQSTIHMSTRLSQNIPTQLSNHLSNQLSNELIVNRSINLSNHLSNHLSNKLTEQLLSASLINEEIDFTDINLNPQLNIALRIELLHYVTQGIYLSIDRLEQSSNQLNNKLYDEFYIDNKYLFRSFKPKEFEKIRSNYNISNDWYKNQILHPINEKLLEQSRSSSNGSFLFYCGKSNNLLVKTINPTECHNLLRILDQYINYTTEYKNNLLVKFLNLFSIKIFNIEFIFIIMRNIFCLDNQIDNYIDTSLDIDLDIPIDSNVSTKLTRFELDSTIISDVTANNLIDTSTPNIDIIYDIKGSWIDRNAKPYPRNSYAICKYCSELFLVHNTNQSIDKCSKYIGYHTPSIIYKDNDLNSQIYLNKSNRINLINILLRDSNALQSMGITDYSLLIGISNKRYNNINSSNDLIVNYTNIYPADSYIIPNIYYFGIVDILQTWTWKKRLEWFVKVYLLRLPSDGISCMSTNEYTKRFQDKIIQLLEHN